MTITYVQTGKSAALNATLLTEDGVQQGNATLTFVWNECTTEEENPPPAGSP